jgi:hypothetical protein
LSRARRRLTVCTSSEEIVAMNVRSLLLAGTVASLAVFQAGAAEPVKAKAVVPEAAPTADAEEQLDQGLKSFGYLAGLARGCVVADQQPKLEREAVDLNAAIARLFGTDRAFLFAASFGYGTSIVVEVDQCKEVLARYDERVAKFRANRGQPK